MSTLDKVYEKFKKEYELNKEIKNIKYPVCFLETLLELKTKIIGREDFKNQVATLVLTLAKTNDRSDYAHIVLYGSPGTGKTEAGKLLGKLFFSMGFLEDIPTKNNLDLNLDEEKMAYIMVFVASLPVFINYLGLVLTILLGILAAIAYYIYELIQDAIFDENMKNGNIKTEDVVKVVSRDDFIGGYIGQSEIKTNKLLNDNVGRVVFIDEAYSLVPGGGNSYLDYGNNVLNIINRFMSEHKNKIIFIFAGYEEQLKNTIFSKQEGFESRIGYTFRFDKYSARELFLIYLKQLNDSKLVYDQDELDYMYELIEKNKSLFDKGQGRDMEKLKALTKSKMMLRKIDDLECDNKITYEDLSYAIDKFRENRMTPKKKKSVLEEFVENF